MSSYQNDANGRLKRAVTDSEEFSVVDDGSIKSGYIAPPDYTIPHNQFIMQQQQQSQQER